MQEVGRRLERSIFSGVIKTRDLDRFLGPRVRLTIFSARIVAMGQGEHPVFLHLDRNLPDSPQTRGHPFCQRDFLREAAHFKARAMRKAACSRKSRSDSVNASSFSLSTSISPITFSDSVITGTTISDCVLPNVGK